MAQYIRQIGNNVIISLHNGPFNSLTHTVRRDLMVNLERAAADKSVSTVILTGLDHFCAGPDIKELNRGEQQSPSTKDIIAYLDTYEKPVIASVRGAAFGSGLELLLACHWRAADSTSMFGFPECFVGLIPGCGGTQRITRLVPPKVSTGFITSGRIIGGVEAHEMNLIDKFTASKAKGRLMDASIALSHSDTVRNTPLSSRRLSNMPVKGDLTGMSLQKLENRLIEENNPIKLSGLAALKAAYLCQSFNEGLEMEANILSVLSKTQESKGTQYNFFNKRLTQHADADPDKFRGSDCHLSPEVHLLYLSKPSKLTGGYRKPKKGPGDALRAVTIMGRHENTLVIAKMCARQGSNLHILESNEELVAMRTEKVEIILKGLKARKADIGTITCSTEKDSLKTADIVFDSSNAEGTFDDFMEMTKECKKKALIVLDSRFKNMETIASTAARPENVIGTHGKRIVEVIPSSVTSPKSLEKYTDYIMKGSKLPILAGNSEGYVKERLIDPCIREALFLAEEGVSFERIGQVLVSRLGLIYQPSYAIGGHQYKQRLSRQKAEAQEAFEKYLKDKEDEKANPSTVFKPQPSSLPERQNPDEEVEVVVRAPVVLSNWDSKLANIYRESQRVPDPALGNKKPSITDARIKIFEEFQGQKVGESRDISDDEIFERCYYSMVNNALALLFNGTAQSADDVDAVFTSMYGFRSSLGGLLYNAERNVGLAKIYKSLKSHHENLYERPWLKPHPFLISIVEAQSSIREELYFIKEQKKAKEAKKKEEKEVEQP